MAELRSNPLQLFHHIVDQLFTLNIKQRTNQIKSILNLSGNKAIPALQLSTLLLFMAQIFINKDTLPTGVVEHLLYIAVHICLFSACQCYHVIFKTACAIFCAICGPISLYSGAMSIQSVYLTTLTIPLLQYLFMKSTHLLTLQIGVQIILICTTYHDSLIGAATYERPENFAQEFRTTYIVTILLLYVIVILMSRVIIFTHSHTAEKKEHDDQRTILLSFSHELRNLITSLIGNIRLANLEQTLPTNIKDLLLNSEVCGDLLLHLVNNVLDSSRIENGQLEADLVPTEMPLTFGRVWSICSELIRRKGLQGRMRIQKSIPKILKMDHHKVTQIILNLVSNSLKFTDAGSINMNVQWLEEANNITDESFQPCPFNDSDDDQDEGLFEKDQQFRMLENEYLENSICYKRSKQASIVHLSDVRRRGVLKIIISDTGCGMTKEDSKKLFTKFSQVGSDDSKKRLGTGLGLFISKQLCQKMGGEIKVYSKKDEGTCFIFCLPLESC